MGACNGGARINLFVDGAHFEEFSLTIACSKFFGAQGAAPPRQSKLSFSTKAKKEETADSEEDTSVKENTDPEKGKNSPYEHLC